MLTAISVAILLSLLLQQGCNQNLCDVATQFRCHNGLCLPKAKVCNGRYDCENGEDELGCGGNTFCRPRQGSVGVQSMYYPVRGCRKPCYVNGECRGRKRCLCDDECGPSCINPDGECESEPPSIEHMANFTVYEGALHVKRRNRYEHAPYPYGTFVEYVCKPGYKLKGPAPRCNGRRKWSNEIPSCVVSCSRRRDAFYINWLGLTCGSNCFTTSDCPTGMICHCDGPCSAACVNPSMDCGEAPSTPNAVVTYTGSGVNKAAHYACNEGYYVNSGQLSMQCLGSGVWIGVTPVCRNFPVAEIHVARRIDSNDIDQKHEIYFMFDISDSVLRRIDDLENEIEFAKRLVRRMEGFEGSISYGIMVFASEILNVHDITQGEVRPDQVLQILDQVFNDAADRGGAAHTRSGTATADALEMLEWQLAAMNIHFPDNKRHVFIFTDGKHTEGRNPVHIRKRIETVYAPSVEFYSITACKSCDRTAQMELLGLSTGEGENYIFIEDFYQLSSYLDKVTNVTLNFAECGQAGDVGSIKKQARFRRSVGGEDAAENAWPWQALITRKSENLKQSLSNKFSLLGGGSIINEHWILTAAHLLAGEEKQDGGWTNRFMVSVGMFERPRSNGEVKKSIQAYSIGKFVEHEGYSKETLDNDIALIRLGSRLDYNMNKRPGTDKGLTYSYYIRPVCLPCTGTCLKREHLINEDGVSLITDDMSDEQKCRVEENFLLSEHAKAVVTGFGYVNRSMRNNYDRDRRFNPARKLQQALLKVDKKSNCDTGIEDIIERGRNPQLRYTENMICFTSGIADKIVDACKGDSGGPVVREVISRVNKDNPVEKSCWVEIGLVSFGFGCGTGEIPGYYTNVARYISWINETTNGILPGY